MLRVLHVSLLTISWLISTHCKKGKLRLTGQTTGTWRSASGAHALSPYALLHFSPDISYAQSWHDLHQLGSNDIFWRVPTAAQWATEICLAAFRGVFKLEAWLRKVLKGSEIAQPCLSLVSASEMWLLLNHRNQTHKMRVCRIPTYSFAMVRYTLLVSDQNSHCSQNATNQSSLEPPSSSRLR